MVGEGASCASTILRDAEEVAAWGSHEAERAASDGSFERRRRREGGGVLRAPLPPERRRAQRAEPGSQAQGSLRARWASVQDGRATRGPGDSGRRRLYWEERGACGPPSPASSPLCRLPPRGAFSLSRFLEAEWPASPPLWPLFLGAWSLPTASFRGRPNPLLPAARPGRASRSPALDAPVGAPARHLRAGGAHAPCTPTPPGFSGFERSRCRAPAGLRPQDCSRRPVSVPRPAHRPSVFTPPPDSCPDLSLLSGPPSPLPETNAPESRWPPRPPVLSSSLCPSLSQGDLSKAETQGHASARPSCSKASLRFRDGGHDP